MPVVRIVEALLDKTRPGWRGRQARRKSLWHLPVIIVMFGLLAGLWFALFRIMWQVHLVWHPEHAGHLQEFWPKGAGPKSFIASALLVLPLFLPALGVSLFLANLLFLLIGPARRAFEREASGDPEMTFRGANRKLLKITLGFLLPIGIGMSLIGAWLLTDFR
jgi:hypothetical protein